jgi:protease-4
MLLKVEKMTFDQVDATSADVFGLVWSDKIGLVDEIGGLNDAIKEAASLAKIKSYRTQNYPFTKKDLNDLLANLPLPRQNNLS